MFIKVIFKKYGFKENKYLMAIIYGLIYFLLSLFIFVIASLMGVKSKNILLFSSLIGAWMVVVYLIKWEFMRWKK